MTEGFGIEGANAFEQEVLADRLHLILECTGEGIYAIDLEGRFTFLNRAGGEILGCSPEQMLGRNAHAVVHHSHADGSTYPMQDCPIFRAFESGTGCRVDTEVMWRSNGVAFPSAYTSFPLRRNGRVEGAVITFTDITDRRRSDEALRRRDRELAEAQRIGKLGSWEWDVPSDRIQWSDELYRIFGVERDGSDLTFERYVDRVHSDDRVRVAELLAAVLRGRENRFELDHRISRAAGKLGWVSSRGEVIRDESGVPVLLRGIALDVTASKMSEAKLRDTASRFRLLQVMANAANDASRVKDALGVAVKELCLYAGWVAGHAYPYPNDLVSGMAPTTPWYLQDPEHLRNLPAALLRAVSARPFPRRV